MTDIVHAFENFPQQYWLKHVLVSLTYSAICLYFFFK